MVVVDIQPCIFSDLAAHAHSDQHSVCADLIRLDDLQTGA
jgi:hypothetical protein